jgi:uncharacterized protein YutE (UPF0331/DUF86 family)
LLPLEKFMIDDVFINKAAVIERCVQRARDEYHQDPATFATNFTRQDAAILNVQRACEAALDIGQHWVRKAHLGIPQSARDVFEILAQHNKIPPALATSLKKMVAFRNIAVNDYQSLLTPILESITREHLDEFLEFARIVLQQDS